MKPVLLAGALMASQVGAQGRPASGDVREFALDAGHTIIEFSVGFAVTHVKGRFTQPRGTILYSDARPESSSVTLIIDAKSIDTGWPSRDEHLRTSDFFDVAKYPTITFQSDRVERRGKSWILHGPFTMHGVTRYIAIPFQLLGSPSHSPGSSLLMLHASGSLRLARKDFGILGGSAHNSWFNALRSATVADSVDISLEVAGWLDDGPRSAEVTTMLERIRTEGVAAQLGRLREMKATRTAADFAALLPGGNVIARALLADARMAEAVALTTGLVELFPENSLAFLVHGQALSETGDTKGALAAYDKALAIDPNNTRALAWKRRLKR